MKKEWDRIWINGATIHPIPKLPTLTEVSEQLSAETTDTLRQLEVEPDSVLSSYVCLFASTEQMDVYCQEVHFLLSKHNDDIMRLIAYYYAGINVDLSLLPSTSIELAQVFRQGLLMTSHIAPEVLTLERHLLRQALERPKFW